MKLTYLTICAAALVACSDSRPTAPGSTHPAPHDGDAHPGQPLAKANARSPKDILEGLVSRQFARVTLPADAFSQSADAVHPDIACPPRGWNGAKCWLIYTPYRNSDPSWENPAFLLAANDTSWLTPNAIQNPIVSYPGTGSYNSDPDHAFDPGTQRLIQVFRVVDSVNRIMLMSTSDARQWTTPVVAFSARSHDAVSPSLVIDRNRAAKVWYVKSGVAGCRASTTTVELRTARPNAGQRFESVRWSAPTATDLSIPGYVVWHLDVAEIPSVGSHITSSIATSVRGSSKVAQKGVFALSSYVALIAAFPEGATCSQSDLWLATSDDGLSWHTLPLPIFWRGMEIATRRSIATWYRGTLRYDAKSDMLDIWPSGLAGPIWTIYHTSVPLSVVTDLMESATPADLRSIRASSALVPAPSIRMP